MYCSTVAFLIFEQICSVFVVNLVNVVKQKLVYYLLFSLSPYTLVYFLCSYFFCLCSGGSLDLIKTYDDIEQFREGTGASSVMLARAAMWNPSIFRCEGMLSVDEVIKEYVKHVSTKIFLVT